jgi:hypothetical protein
MFISFRVPRSGLISRDQIIGLAFVLVNGLSDHFVNIGMALPWSPRPMISRLNALAASHTPVVLHPGIDLLFPEPNELPDTIMGNHRHQGIEGLDFDLQVIGQIPDVPIAVFNGSALFHSQDLLLISA